MAMKQYENILVTVSEECAEIQQAVSKALRFGLDNHHPDNKITNAEQIIKEYYELSALVGLLQSYSLLPTYNEYEITTIFDKKIANVAKWQEVSFDVGTLEGK